jgi:hypothetical protein
LAGYAHPYTLVGYTDTHAHACAGYTRTGQYTGAEYADTHAPVRRTYGINPLDAHPDTDPDADLHLDADPRTGRRNDYTHALVIL